MNSRVLVIFAAGILVVGGAVAVFVMSGGGARVPETKAEPAAPRAEARPAPEPSATAAAPKPAGSSAPKTAEPQPTPEARPTLGTLIIESDVPETSVFVDRVYLGNAPVTARDLPPGQHRLNMSVAGYEGISETIDVEPGTKTISIKFKEIKLDEKIDVTHKHGIGSCNGTLKATPQRLSYETTNAGDAFGVALTSLDTFQMDYIAKTLKVKVRDGKTYNFTPVEGSADALYQFHQAVEKVRQRLLAGR